MEKMVPIIFALGTGVVLLSLFMAFTSQYRKNIIWSKRIWMFVDLLLFYGFYEGYLLYTETYWVGG